jgi:uncharacterized YccA/Bax inhibitor family protein
MRSMESNNPVFSRNETLARGMQQGVGFHAPAPSAEDVAAIYATPQRMTLDDVIMKTGILLAIVVVTGAFSWTFLPTGVALLAGLVGFALAMVNIFKKSVSPGLVMAYAVAQGVFLGAISAAYNAQFNGIVVQAVVGTAAVFGAVLVGYRSGKLRATPKFAKVVTFGLVGLVAVFFLNILASALGAGDALGLGTGGPFAILLTLGLIVFGALTFVLDFDAADRMVAAGVPEQESWRVSFGLVVGLIFLYLNILRLLSYLQSD